MIVENTIMNLLLRSEVMEDCYLTCTKSGGGA